jgi:hypothetical protein
MQIADAVPSAGGAASADEGPGKLGSTVAVGCDSSADLICSAGPPRCTASRRVSLSAEIGRGASDRSCTSDQYTDGTP